MHQDGDNTEVRDQAIAYTAPPRLHLLTPDHLDKFATLISSDGWVSTPAFELIANLVTEPLFFKDIEGRYVFANAAARWMLTGDPVADIIGRRDAEFLPVGQGIAMLAADQDMLKCGPPSIVEEHFERRGETVSFLIACAPVLNSDKHVIGLLGSGQDVSEERRLQRALWDAEAKLRVAEEAVREADRRAKRQDDAKAKFLAAASHDLRQPLQAMVFFASMAARNVTPDGRAAMERLERAVTALAKLLDNLLDVARLDIGLIHPRLEEFSIYDVIRSVADIFTPQARAKGLNLYAVHSPIRVRSDRKLLIQMISHLVENAVNHTDRGRILIDCVPDTQHVVVEVRDSGVGIAAEHIDFIWDEFYQVGNTRRQREDGQGLGLSVVQRISRLLDHPVAVESRVNSGTTFTIEVPIAGEVTADDWVTITPHAKVAAPKVVTVPERRPLILVVDDDEMIRDSFEVIFELWDEPWDTVLAESADDAFAQLPQGAVPDFIVMDYRLGAETGEAATQRIRRHFNREIPAMLLTGDVGDDVQQKAHMIGMPIMYKPVDTRALHDMISTQLEMTS